MNAPYDDERLSKRELVAAMAMQALLSSGEYVGCDDSLARDSILAADALLARLAAPAVNPQPNPAAGEDECDE